MPDIIITLDPPFLFHSVQVNRKNLYNMSVCLFLKYQYGVFHLPLCNIHNIEALLAHMCGVRHFYFFYGSFPICR